MANPLLLITAAAAGVLLLGQKRKAKTMPSAGDDSLPFDDTPEPSNGMPALGAGAACYAGIISKTPGGGGLDPSVLKLMSPAARAVVTPPATAPYYGKRVWSAPNGSGPYIYAPATTSLTPAAQVAAFKAAIQSLSSNQRTTQSATARIILHQLAPECDWDLDLRPTFGHPGFGKWQYNLFVSVWYLVAAASAQIGITIRPNSLMKPIDNPNGLIIGRGYLGLSDIGIPGKVFIPAGRRIELLAGEYLPSEWPRPRFFHAEPLIARVINSDDGRPTVEVLGTFQDRDVSPRYSHKHGIQVGRRLRLPGTGTTGIRMIYPEGFE
jgi:hypothetical protein